MNMNGFDDFEPEKGDEKEAEDPHEAGQLVLGVLLVVDARHVDGRHRDAARVRAQDDGPARRGACRVRQ